MAKKFPRRLAAPLLKCHILPRLRLIARACGELYEKIGVVGLYLRLVRRLIADDRAASLTAVNYDISLFRVGKGLDRAKYSAAVVCSVPRVYINVERAKAEGTMVARGVAQGHNLSSAAFANKALVVFLESLFLQDTHSFINYFPMKFYFPTQNFEKMSETISSPTSLPSSSPI